MTRLQSEHTDPRRIRVILVGTVHRDPDGEALLTRLLARLDPDLVSVEVSPLSVRFREKQSQSLDRLLAIRLAHLARLRGVDPGTLLENASIMGIKRQIQLPFEYTACRRFALDAGIPVVCTDDSRTARGKLSLFSGLISLKNLDTLLNLAPVSWYQAISREIRRAAHLFGTTDPPVELRVLRGTAREEWYVRTHVVRRKVLRMVRALRERGGGTLVHVGGWLHTGGLGHWPNVARALEELSPTSMLLNSGVNPTESEAFPTDVSL